MSSKRSTDCSPHFPKFRRIVPFRVNPITRGHQRLAYIHPGWPAGPHRAPHDHPQMACSPVATDGSGFISTVNCSSPICSGPTSCSSEHVFDQLEAPADLPPSSTPDLLPSSADNLLSPHVPLAQKIFTRRLHFLLQTILDQKSDEKESNLDESTSQASQDDKYEREMVYQDGRGDTQRNGELREDVLEDTHEDGNISDISENSSSVSSSKKHSQLEKILSNTTLTHRNKRKHDLSHGYSESFSGDTTDVGDEGEELLPNRKKARVGTWSATSVSTTFSYQTNETASSRKLRSLTTSSSGFDSTVVNSPSHFSHAIIHPPSTPPHIPRSVPEIAEARINALLRREVSYRIQDGLPPGPFVPSDFSSDQQDNIFGIEPEFRQIVVEWILDILPPSSLRSRDLHQHLKYSEETRFHAIYLFTRFFLRLAEFGVRHGVKTSITAANGEFTWHLAFCCLAISTKFYHDFLFPLNPIYSREFLAISPQLTSHYQFERFQRELLEAFDYEVHGVTPHAFFDELWDALPSLQEILKFKRTRVEARDEMWDLLQIAVLEFDVMRFPVSLLTAAALIESILITLVDEFENNHDGCHSGVDSPASPQKGCCNAREGINLVSREISKLLGTTVTDLESCRHWLANITSK